MKNYDAKQHIISKSQTFPVSATAAQHHQKPSDHLGLNYVTERILASVLPRRTASAVQQQQQAIKALQGAAGLDADKNRPSHGSQIQLLDDDAPQDIYEEELISMLEQKHGKNYKLFDLESCISTITLEKLCELCKHIDSWLGSGREKVVVLQDRGERQRLGSAIAAYLEYLDICASNFPHRNGLSNEDVRAQNTIARNWLDLDVFSMKKFLEDVIGPLRVPSHRRYLQYFSGLLSGKIKMNSLPLFLKYITLESPPSWLQYEPISQQQAEWRSFIKIYEGLNCVFTSDIHVIPITTRQFIYETGHLRLRGDVIIRCYQIVTNERIYQHQEKRELIFSTQFHTCAVTSRDVAFALGDLDYACDDPRFPADHKVTLHFGDSNQTNDNRVLYFQSPLVKLEPLNAVAKYDSLEHFGNDSSSHTQGPLDGSLYATILKSPKSPIKTPTYPFASNNNNNTIESITPGSPFNSQRATANHNLISPPPEFSNKKLIEVTERYSTINGSPYPASKLNAATEQTKSTSSTTRHSFTPTPSYEEIRVPSRNSSRDVTLRHHQSYQSQPQQPLNHQTVPRPSSSASSTTYHHHQQQQQHQHHPDVQPRSSSVIRAASYTPSNYSASSSTQPLRTIENYHYNTVQNGSTRSQTVSYQDGRESVRSPLTLSMDSGISSSGIANRRIQSSVSPSSFPSQASPQDRHQELDDILSDMLMTVQDIPDINKNTRKQTIAKNQQLSGSINLVSGNGANSAGPYCTDTVKRSQSCASDKSLISTTTTRSQTKDRCIGDYYDTASTTTTLTPTPSETGRDTPLQVQQQQPSSASTHTVTSNTTNTYSTVREHSNVELLKQQQQQRERELIMDLQNQSYGYSQALQSRGAAADNHSSVNTVYNSALTSEDEENIPYHAREDSRPFTYGNPAGVQLSPTGSGTGMIKLQSGLSSPSLVRKVYGGGGGANAATGQNATTGRKPTNARNEFEEMLLQRREKIMNEKYSIGDKTPNGGGGSGASNGNQYAGSANKWNNSSTSASNGYHYHEPLKRSNTMDGGFGRSYSTDGSSGQTWLQLQQQKLRAKKELQNRGGGEREYYERSISETRSRPFRSRSSASQRYDGYASDTATFDANAFIDEVDYRRPLHVQTPHRPNERNYHTITTKTTISNERPFVSVKRAHEQAKNNSIGSSPVSPLSLLNASPHGHIEHAQSPTSPNGLLLLADNNIASRQNGHSRLGSDSSNSSPSSISSSGIVSTTNSQASEKSSLSMGGDNKCRLNQIDEQLINNKRNHPHYKNHVRRPVIEETDVELLLTNETVRPTTTEATTVASAAAAAAATGQLALDRLLESLAIESDIMEQQLAQLNNNNNNHAHADRENRKKDTIFTYPTICDNNNSNAMPANAPFIASQNGVHANLNDVIANLTEFTRHEAMRQMNLMNGNANSSDSHHQSHNNNNYHHHASSTTPPSSTTSTSNVFSNNHTNNNYHLHNNYNNYHINHTINGNHRLHYQEPTNAVKRLTSESENSSSISPSLSERSNGVSWSDQVREESFSSYRSETEAETSTAGSPRPETPAFPLTPRTPYGLNGNTSPALPPKSPTSIRRFYNSTWSLRSAKSSATTYDWSKDLYAGNQHHPIINQNDSISCYTSRRNSTTSMANSEPQEIAPHLVKFVRDSSKYWYKPNISREEAVALLRNAPPGTFIVRDSTTFAKAFGLVVKVAYPPPGIQAKGPAGDELVRHFLVEPTTRGVRLKGCSNEPVFTSLSALVYQHSITPLALPCRLLIPDQDLQSIEFHSPAQHQLITQGAACNVLYLFTCETESLTGPEAVRKSISLLYSRKPLPKPTEVHFKVSNQGITLTDNQRQLFFRKHYPAANISYCGLDPDDRRWSVRTSGEVPVSNKCIFAFVARRSTSSTDNQCHVFCELESNQPAAAITAFANKIIPSYGASTLSRNI